MWAVYDGSEQTAGEDVLGRLDEIEDLVNSSPEAVLWEATDALALVLIKYQITVYSSTFSAGFRPSNA